MSLITRSKVNRRVYKRKFDHDEARARYAAEGVSIAALAREYGVSSVAVKRVLDPETRTRMDGRAARYQMRGVCSDCGRGGIATKADRCKPCSDEYQRQKTEQRPTELRCSKCMRWLPDRQFYRNKGAPVNRRGRKGQCIECDNALRVAYRVKHRTECIECGQLVEGKGRGTHRGRNLDPNRPYWCRECWVNSKRKEPEVALGGYVVLVETDEGPGLWRVMEFSTATSKLSALAAAFPEGPPKERVVVVSGQVWTPRKVITKQVLDLDEA